MIEKRLIGKIMNNDAAHHPKSIRGPEPSIRIGKTEQYSSRRVSHINADRSRTSYEQTWFAYGVWVGTGWKWSNLWFKFKTNKIKNCKIKQYNLKAEKYNSLYTIPKYLQNFIEIFHSNIAMLPKYCKISPLNIRVQEMIFTYSVCTRDRNFHRRNHTDPLGT